MTLPLFLGAGLGMGLWCIARGLNPPRPSLADALASLRRLPAPAPVLSAVEAERGLVSRLGAPLATGLFRRAGSGVIPASVQRELAVLGRPVDRHLADKCGLALVGLLLVPATVALLALGSVTLPLLLPLWASLILAVGGFFLPDLAVRAEAAKRRRDFRHALSSFLDLVVISLAAGGGVEGALRDAAGIGQGWAFASLRQALATARLTREPPWSTLGRLGAELGVPELEEMAASVGLAGTEGARVRQSLAAKAASLRGHRLADAESDAQAATERMSFPVVLLFMGFLIFVGFPAIQRVIFGL